MAIGFENELKKEIGGYSRHIGEAGRITFKSGKFIEGIVEDVNDGEIDFIPLGKSHVKESLTTISNTGDISNIYSEPLIIIPSVYNPRE